MDAACRVRDASKASLKQIAHQRYVDGMRAGCRLAC